MANKPDAVSVKGYLGVNTSAVDSEIVSALAAEAAAQAKRCRLPEDDHAWPPDLIEALHRRVAANLANRNLPLGIQAHLTEMAVSSSRVGGLDREVRRLEAPYRKVPIG